MFLYVFLCFLICGSGLSQTAEVSKHLKYCEFVVGEVAVKPISGIMLV